MKYLLILLLMVAGVQVNAQIQDLPDTVIIERGIKALPVCDSILGVLTAIDIMTRRVVKDTAWKIRCAEKYIRQNRNGVVCLKLDWQNAWSYYWSNRSYYNSRIVDLWFEKLAFKPIKK